MIRRPPRSTLFPSRRSSDLDRKPDDIIGKIWKQMTELGWTAMAIPEKYGGGGNSLTDVAVLFEELGVGPVPGPLFSSAGISTAAVFLRDGHGRDRKSTRLNS